MAIVGLPIGEHGRWRQAPGGIPWLRREDVIDLFSALGGGGHRRGQVAWSGTCQKPICFTYASARLGAICTLKIGAFSQRARNAAGLRPQAGERGRDAGPGFLSSRTSPYESVRRQRGARGPVIA